jgi:hypothetical protein
VDFFAKIEINSNAPDLSQCTDCPTPPGLPPVPRLFIVADDNFTVGWADENTPLDVLENDGNGFPLADGIVFEYTTTTGGGTLTEILDGGEVIGFEYTPPEDAVFVWDGVSDYAEFTDTFTYNAEDSEGNVSINTATVTITATNFLPTVSGDSETIHMSTAGNPTSAGFDLSGNIVDPDGTPGTLTLAKGDNDVVYGVASVDDSTSTAAYVPFEGYVGDDDFDYTVTDSTIDYQGEPVASATLEVTVENEQPTGSGDLGIIHMDQTSIQTQVNLTSPVSVEDVDGVDPLSIVEDTYIGSNGGTLVYDGTNWTYTPNPATPGYVGDPLGLPDETFTIQIWDGQYDYDLDQAVTADAQVSVELFNILPFVEDRSFLDQPEVVSINGDLFRYDLPDTYAQGEIDDLTITLLENGGALNPDGTLTTALGGTVTLAPDGESFTYDPPSNSFTGPDSFTFEVWDGQRDYPVEGDPTNVTVTGTVTVSFVAPTPPPVPFIPPAPGLQREVVEVSGCPSLMQWAASELGTDEGTIQVQIANALSSTSSIQPCDACSDLKAAATILQDVDGTRVAALAEMINEFASSTAPPTEEQMASIADAIANDIEGNSQYAAAGEYLDALATYVGILNNQMGLTADESIQFATDNYIEQLAEDEDTGVAAYVASRLAALGGS